MSNHSQDDGDEPGFQIAPMIDVLLVLLIFFMSITTLQIARVDRTVNLPVAPRATQHQDLRDETIINVRWDPVRRQASITSDDAAYATAEALVPLLSARQVGTGHHRVVIRGDRLTPAQTISQITQAAARAGIADVTFSALNH